MGELTKALEYKGILFIKQREYEKGFEYIVQSENSIKDYTADTCSYEYNNVIPDLFFKQSKFEYAIQYYLRNVSRSINCKPLAFQHFFLIQNSLTSIGLCYTHLTKYDSASKYLDSSLSFINNSRTLFPGNNYLNVAAGAVYSDQGYLANLKGDLKSAEDKLVKSIALVKDEDKNFTIFTRFALYKVYLAGKNFTKAKEQLDAISATLVDVDSEPIMRIFYSTRASYFEGMKQYDSAFANLQLFNKYRDEWEAKTRKFTDLDIGSELKVKQAELQNELLQKNVSLKGFQLTVAVLACFLALVLIFFIWNNYKKSNRHVKELEELTREISLNHEHLQKSFTSLEDSHAENSRLIKTVAHDLKNPIWGISTLSYPFTKKDEFDNEQVKSSMTLINSTCKNLNSIINDLLIDKGKSILQNRELVDMAWLLENCSRLLKIKADEKKQKILMNAQSLLVSVNREKIWRVMSNLIHNAIKFSNTGAVIDLKLVMQNNKALLSVKDEGIGIPDDIKNNIFSLDDITKSRSGTEGEKSYGLGLSITKKIVEEHEGKIWFESIEGKGTIFYVELPLQPTG